jgi:hypothetical protein
LIGASFSGIASPSKLLTGNRGSHAARRKALVETSTGNSSGRPKRQASAIRPPSDSLVVARRRQMAAACDARRRLSLRRIASASSPSRGLPPWNS